MSAIGWLRVHDPAYAARVLGVRAPAEAPSGQPAAARQSASADVDALMALVAEQASGDAFAARCVALLGQARAEMGNERTDTRRVVAATEEVSRLLIRAHESGRAMSQVGLPLAAYCAAWLGALTYLAFGALRLYPDSDALSGRGGAAWLLMAAVLWGAMGGVLDALFALWQRFGERTFDVRFWLWYVLNPALGAGLGIVVYLLSTTGYLAVTGGAPVADGVAAPRLNPNGVILLAFVAGFKQTTSYAMMSRIIGSVFNTGADRDERRVKEERF